MTAGSLSSGSQQRILGIDPGSRIAGFGVIEQQGKQWICVTAGCLTLKGSTFLQRLQDLQDSLLELLNTFKPTQVAIEDVFVHKNARSALKLGHARGVALASLISFRLPIYEYAPRQIKLALVGKGNASKSQVQSMVKVLLNLDISLPLDASDALAIALTHAHVQSSFGGGSLPGSFSRRKTSKRSKAWEKHDWKNKRSVD